MGLAVHVGPPGGWVFGVVGQHWWDYAGSSNEDHVSLTNIQYLGYYRLNVLQTSDLVRISSPTGRQTVTRGGQYWLRQIEYHLILPQNGGFAWPSPVAIS